MAKDKTAPKQKQSLKNKIFKVLGLLIPLVLMYWIFVVKIPSQVSYAEVWATVEALTFGQNFLLFLGGILTIIVYGWTSATVLPGLSLKKGIQSAVSGQLTSVVLPAPVDLVIRFSMYKSYGFSADKSTVAVGMAGIARYFTVFAMPLIGLAALILAGQGTAAYTKWLIAVGAAFIFALWFMRLILSSKKSARRAGKFVQKTANFALKLIRRKPNNKIEDVVVDFGARMHDVAINNFRPIAVSNIAWGFSCYLVLFFALRFCGVDSAQMSASYILLVTGLMLLFNAFPITPGGIGVTETILLSIIPFSSPAEQAAFVSALFVYRIYTWLLPMPVGAIAYGTWRYQVSHKKLN